MYLSELKRSIPDINGGVYREDVLLIIRKPTVRHLENYKKKFHLLKKYFGLKITSNNEHISINYLDLNLDLKNRIFRPYHQSNEILKYINAFSNNPFSIKIGLIVNISKRISILSPDIDIFSNNVEHYNKALAKASYKENIGFTNDVSHLDDRHSRFNWKYNQNNPKLTLSNNINNSNLKRSKHILNNKNQKQISLTKDIRNIIITIRTISKKKRAYSQLFPIEQRLKLTSKKSIHHFQRML